MVGCTTIESADTFYTKCTMYLDALSEDDTESVLLAKFDRYFKCGDKGFFGDGRTGLFNDCLY